MRKYKECRGCTLHHDDSDKSAYCVYQAGNIAEQCPCLNCLTKPICDKHGCELRGNKYRYSVQQSMQVLNEGRLNDTV